MILSAREKLLLVVLALTVAGALLFFGFSALGDYERSLARQIARKQVLLSRATTLKAGLSQLRVRGPRSKRKGTLIGLMENLAERNGLKDRIRLNRVPIDRARGLEAIDVRLDQLALDEMVAFVHSVENARPILVVDQLEITSSFRSTDLLRLSLRVLAKK